MYARGSRAGAMAIARAAAARVASSEARRVAVHTATVAGPRADRAALWEQVARVAGSNGPVIRT